MAEISIVALRAFVAVAEHLHFTRAAQSLYMTTPALSQQVHRLESVLGTSLFVRSSRRVELSDEGAELLPLAREAIAAVDRVHDWTKTRSQRILRVGFVHVGAPEVLTAILAAVPEQLDGISMEFRHIERDAIPVSLRDGDIDVAFAWGPNWFEGVTTRTLMTAPRAVLVGAEAAAEIIDPGTKQVSISLLGAHPFLVPSAADERYTSWATVDPRPDGSRPQYGPRVRNLEEAFPMVVTGLGLYLVPEPTAQAVHHPGVMWATVNDIPGATFNICTRRAHASSLSERFCLFVSQQFAAHSEKR